MKYAEKNVKRVMSSAMMVMVLWGCQTTSGQNANPNNLDPKAVAQAQQIIGRGCTLSNNKNTHTKDISTDNVVIFAIDNGKEGWVRVDSKIEGARRMRRGNVYYNVELKKLYCGSSSWNASGYDSSQIF